MRILFFYTLTMLCFISKAQLTEDFNDFSFTNGPVWIGDDSLFQINSAGQLQSKGTAGTSKDISLATNSTNLKNCEWNFWCRFNLSPSTQNFARFYLTSDQYNLKSALNGYYIQLGGSTGNTDTISLYRQTGNTRTRIIAGRPGTVAKNNNIVQIKVFRDSIGNWQLFSDTTGSNDFIFEGNGFDTTFNSSAFCGCFIKFTSTNVTNHWLDDIYIGPKRYDFTAAKVQSLDIISNSIIRLSFDEKLDAISALNKLNYTVSPPAANPMNVTFDDATKKNIRLDLSTVLTSGTYYKIDIKGIEDAFGNKSDTTINFLYFLPQKHDILITELMPDPSPPVGLPDFEYVELYNRSPFPINLKSWTIEDLSTTATFPNTIIYPDSFVIVCAAANQNLFNNFGKTVAVTSLPSLNNTGDKIIIRNSSKEIIHEVSYDMSWYKNSTKSNGGWSLEMINPFELCKETDNWHASENAGGGTPGKANSIFIKSADIRKPELYKFYFLDSQNLVLVFDERMDSVSMLNFNISSISGHNVSEKTIKGFRFDTAFIKLNKPFTSYINNQFFVDSVMDCSGNINKNISFGFYFMPHSAARQNDVLINEIFPNPKTGTGLPNAEFVELYNRSNKLIKLKNWTIEDDSKKAVFADFDIYPDSFLIICSETNASALSSLGSVCGLKNFPSLSSDDNITLKDNNGFMIHNINYKGIWFKNTLKEAGGWSLEMADKNNPCAGAENWTASINSKGGTPGKTNSVIGLRPDNKAPSLIRAYPANEKMLVLYFDETLDSLSVKLPAMLTLGKSDYFLNNWGFCNKSYDKLWINFIDSMSTKTLYNIRIDSLSDCVFNNISNEKNSAEFGVSEVADSSDIIINEVLFNPRSGGSDFVELYNRSDKFIDLKKYFIANTDDENKLKEFYAFGLDGRQIAPGSFLVISPDINNIKREYYVPNPEFMLESKLPSYNDDKGTVLLTDSGGRIFDIFSYDDKMHFTFIDKKEGVSLERINYFKESYDRNNWTSASSASGYATPTFKNSQYMQNRNSASVFDIYPQTFSPDEDGYNDLVSFNYKIADGASVGKLEIYNSDGVMIKSIFRNFLLGQEGTLVWNGIQDDGRLGQIGIYIALFEYYSLHGQVTKIKKAFVLAAKL